MPGRRNKDIGERGTCAEVDSTKVVLRRVESGVLRALRLTALACSRERLAAYCAMTLGATALGCRSTAQPMPSRTIRIVHAGTKANSSNQVAARPAWSRRLAPAYGDALPFLVPDHDGGALVVFTQTDLSTFGPPIEPIDERQAVVMAVDSTGHTRFTARAGPPRGEATAACLDAKGTVYLAGSCYWRAEQKVWLEVRNVRGELTANWEFGASYTAIHAVFPLTEGGIGMLVEVNRSLDLKTRVLRHPGVTGNLVARDGNFFLVGLDRTGSVRFSVQFGRALVWPVPGDPIVTLVESLPAGAIARGFDGQGRLVWERQLGLELDQVVPNPSGGFFGRNPVREAGCHFRWCSSVRDDLVDFDADGRELTRVDLPRSFSIASTEAVTRIERPIPRATLASCGSGYGSSRHFDVSVLGEILLQYDNLFYSIHNAEGSIMNGRGPDLRQAAKHCEPERAWYVWGLDGSIFATFLSVGDPPWVGVAKGWL
jgi:hypothetical protein